MKSLDFKIGGEPIIFDQIVDSLKCLETNLPLSFSQTLSSIKSKSVQIALNYQKNQHLDKMYSNEIVSLASTYLGIKYEEKKLGM